MRIKQRGKHDQNFDHLAEKFEKSIYGTLKGEWRLKLLQEDLQALYEKGSLDIWDAGCGLGQMALWFAKRGHRLTCCDISYKMLEKAKILFAKESAEADFHQAPSQELAKILPQQDLVLFHAVIEWLAKPLGSLEVISDRVKPGGHLSLLFFNHHSLIYRNILRGGWRLQTILSKAWYGKGKKLTPPYPQKPEELLRWLKHNGYTIKAHTGIRVFHDYMDKSALELSDTDELMALEYQYCREETFRNMGRYVHILAQKEEN
ncbi:methyltransferase domain-containing protein [Sulfurovum sp.]|jgi:S-adenosylmethionine-dependent methyltransferase|uniref:methyltransferase domain-containing protein n=1 Tax=Sulfurovum sp. TaxID=1969726 RepID=UPI0025F052BA|nr:methyltransferase domain-containing protein [Sulfurovum sp.]